MSSIRLIIRLSCLINKTRNEIQLLRMFRDISRNHVFETFTSETPNKQKQIKRPTVLFGYWDILCGIFQAYASNLGTTPVLISETLTIKHAKITQYL